MSEDRRRDARAARKARLAERKQALRALGQQRLARGKERQAQAVERLRERRAAGGGAAKRWRPSRWWWVVLLLILLLLLCQPCRCTPPEPVGPAVVPVQLEPESGIEAPEPPPPAPLPRTPRRPRPALPAPDPGPPSWIDAFRLQVSARAPRLAQCLEGSQAPGRFKWTTSVDPTDGSVSEHSLQPVLLSTALSASERTCVLRVLSNPPYRLKTGSEPSTPSRVGLVVEF